jgi:hypothetical protein
MKIIVHVSRLDWGVFSGREGDIAAAYSAPALAGCGEGKGISTFRHDGRLWTVGGRCGSWLSQTADAHELIPAEDYTGADSAPYSYEGRPVTYKSRKYRLGQKTEFVAADRTVAEWCVHLRQTYERGGYFTNAKFGICPRAPTSGWQEMLSPPSDLNWPSPILTSTTWWRSRLNQSPNPTSWVCQLLI